MVIKTKITERNWKEHLNPNDIQTKFNKWLNALIDIARKSIQTTQTFKGSSTGPLRNDTTATIMPDGFEFTSNPIYSSWVDQGRGEVVPVRAKCLRFVIDGRVIFTMRSKPVSPREFMKEASKAVESSAKELATQIFNEARS